MKALVRYWKPKLRLHEWQIRTVFDTGYPGRAACEASLPYKEATLTFNLVRCAELNEDLEACVLHELLHPYTWEQAEMNEEYAGTNPDLIKRSEDLEEDATTELELLLLHNVPRLYPLPTP